MLAAGGINRYWSLDQAYSTGTTDTNFRYSTTFTNLAQSFTAGVTKKLPWAGFMFAKVGNPTGNVWLTLYDALGGNLLATSDVISIANMGFGNVLNYFNFSTPYAMTATTQYYLVINGDFAVSTTNYLTVRRNSSSGYAGGTGYYYDGATWTDLTADFRFATYTNADGGYFDIDGADTANVAALTALKGGVAPASTDTICVAAGRTLTIADGDTLNHKIIVEGDICNGAAPAARTAAEKYGLVRIVGGSTIVNLGDSTNTNSGIKMFPTTPDATVSKGCRLIFDMSNGKDIVITNSVGSLNTNNRYTINNFYGDVNTINGYNAGAGRAAQVQINYSYTTPYGVLAGDSSKTNLPPIVNNNVTSPLGTNVGNILFTLPNTAIDLACDLRNNTLDMTGVTAQHGYIAQGSSSTRLGSGGSVDVSGSHIICPNLPSNTYATFPLYLYNNGAGLYSVGYKATFADLRPTQIQPSGLTFLDLQDGTVKVTVDATTLAALRTLGSNGIEDYIQLYDASNNARGGACSKTRYVAVLDRKPANCFIVAGVPLSAMTGWYAKSTSDNNTYSLASAVASTITPALLPLAGNILTGAGAGQLSAENVGDTSLLTAANTKYLSLEAGRNSTNLTAAAIPVGGNVKIAGAQTDGAFNESARNTADSTKYKADEHFLLLNVDTVGSCAGGALNLPGQVLGLIGTPINTTSILWSWSMPETTLTAGPASTFILKRGATTIQSGVVGLSYLETGLTAATAYSATVAGVNTAGMGTASAAASATTKSAEAFLTRIEDALTAYLGSALRTAGYYYDWTYTTQRDNNLAPCSSTAVAAWVDLTPVENSVDAEAHADFNAYHNKITTVIRSMAMLSADTSNPKEAYKKVCAKMSEDIKKLLGTNLVSGAYAIAFWNEVATVDYKGSEIEWDDQSEDTLKPGKLKSTFEIGYIQRRREPNQIAL
jgi:hypothetical protein